MFTYILFPDDYKMGERSDCRIFICSNEILCWRNKRQRCYRFLGVVAQVAKARIDTFLFLEITMNIVLILYSIT